MTDETVENPKKDDEYLYKTAGVRERPGHVPVWLAGVALALLIWAVYYLVVYWTPT